MIYPVNPPSLFVLAPATIFEAAPRSGPTPLRVASTSGGWLRKDGPLGSGMW